MSSLVFSGKVGLITGGARGIGKATALKLAQSGCDIAIVYYNSSDEAQSLVNEITGMGRKAVALQADVADCQSVKDMFSQFREHFKHLNFLVSNAASGVLKPALKMSTKHWRWCLETNALALNHLVTEGLALMPKNSRVIALSSLGASRAIPNYAFIGASKAALEALVRSLSLELASYGITVNTVSAGVVDTDALKHFPNREQLLDEYQAHALADRALTPEDVANAIYLLCLPEAAMINAHTLYVDAGYSQVG
ncbi:Enoyl-[acyl-carrier-protein] reductase [NADPH] FabL [Legionella pneumophila]|uniref:Glucose 1-dehydrogenase n=1 Tax=Legionella pneumophila subsp. pneumophila TaxID=91891 RepID=A0AAV2UTP8_LEGPN|nr:enoyl-[acyl-carrier-protein] reductase FabL [Legionella pneumophila]MCK1850294.1 enoyl-[acyl-carrier-protein] reductase FabL [Legionella pneumophila]MCZ4804331.1 enoyl-[acyl-carrier-protein] reductase FabL [Legionella pneumophila]MDI9852828.1 enoyl-[acyl-carrier-protein] reductase FabL [Legionella pneumophila]MDO5160051.1 enoyl-[acyl-carrier-protein] reductase FabL [Legionella pneumophila]MDO5162545.1 enoyl-[acyl-carrier-protein] reductase FabL [Legionella pneumophila]